MRILFNDVIQNSNAPGSLKTPALSDTEDFEEELVIELLETVPISAVGIGNTDGCNFSITFNDTEKTVFNFSFKDNGLYNMDKTIKASVLTLKADATFIGRLGAGIGVNLGTSIRKEPGWRSTSVPRTTLSGQVIPGAGGYNYRTLSVDTRYKLGKEAVEELEAGYKVIGLGYPFFIDFTDECYKFLFERLYAVERNQASFSLESGVRKFLYSHRFEFVEAF